MQLDIFITRVYLFVCSLFISVSWSYGICECCDGPDRRAITAHTGGVHQWYTDNSRKNDIGVILNHINGLIDYYNIISALNEVPETYNKLEPHEHFIWYPLYIDETNNTNSILFGNRRDIVIDKKNGSNYSAYLDTITKIQDIVTNQKNAIHNYIESLFVEVITLIQRIDPINVDDMVVNVNECVERYFRCSGTNMVSLLSGFNVILNVLGCNNHPFITRYLGLFRVLKEEVWEGRDYSTNIEELIGHLGTLKLRYLGRYLDTVEKKIPQREGGGERGVVEISKAPQIKITQYLYDYENNVGSCFQLNERGIDGTVRLTVLAENLNVLAHNINVSFGIQGGGIGLFLSNLFAEPITAREAENVYLQIENLITSIKNKFRNDVFVSIISHICNEIPKIGVWLDSLKDSIIGGDTLKDRVFCRKVEELFRLCCTLEGYLSDPDNAEVPFKFLYDVLNFIKNISNVNRGSWNLFVDGGFFMSVEHWRNMQNLGIGSIKQYISYYYYLYSEYFKHVIGEAVKVGNECTYTVTENTLLRHINDLQDVRKEGALKCKWNPGTCNQLKDWFTAVGCERKMVIPYAVEGAQFFDCEYEYKNGIYNTGLSILANFFNTTNLNFVNETYKKPVFKIIDICYNELDSFVQNIEDEGDEGEKLRLAREFLENPVFQEGIKFVSALYSSQPYINLRKNTGGGMRLWYLPLLNSFPEVWRAFSDTGNYDRDLPNYTNRKLQGVQDGMLVVVGERDVGAKDPFGIKSVFMNKIPNILFKYAKVYTTYLKGILPKAYNGNYNITKQFMDFIGTDDEAPIADNDLNNPDDYDSNNRALLREFVNVDNASVKNDIFCGGHIGNRRIFFDCDRFNARILNILSGFLLNGEYIPFLWKSMHGTFWYIRGCRRMVAFVKGVINLCRKTHEFLVPNKLRDFIDQFKNVNINEWDIGAETDDLKSLCRILNGMYNTEGRDIQQFFIIDDYMRDRNILNLEVAARINMMGLQESQRNELGSIQEKLFNKILAVLGDDTVAAIRVFCTDEINVNNIRNLNFTLNLADDFCDAYENLLYAGNERLFNFTSFLSMLEAVDNIIAPTREHGRVLQALPHFYNNIYVTKNFLEANFNFNYDRFKALYELFSNFIKQLNTEKARIFYKVFDRDVFDVYKQDVLRRSILGSDIKKNISNYIQALNINDLQNFCNDDQSNDALVQKFLDGKHLKNRFYEDFVSFRESVGIEIDRIELNKINGRIEYEKDRPVLSREDLLGEGLVHIPENESHKMSLYQRLVRNYDYSDILQHRHDIDEYKWQNLYLTDDNIEGLGEEEKKDINTMMKAGLPEAPEGLQETIEDLHLKMLSGAPRPGQDKVIGTKGTSAEVFLYNDGLPGHQPLVIKVVKTKFQKKSEIKMLYEALINLRIRNEQRAQNEDSAINKYVVKVHNVFYCCNPIGMGDYQHNLFVVMEYCTKGDFKNYLIKKGTLPSYQEITRYYKQILSGIEALHRIGILHMDIKLANLLVYNAGGINGNEADDQLKLVDFGYSILFNTARKNLFCYGKADLDDAANGANTHCAKAIKLQENFYWGRLSFEDKLRSLRYDFTEEILPGLDGLPTVVEYENTKNNEAEQRRLDDQIVQALENYAQTKRREFMGNDRKGFRCLQYCPQNSYWVMGYRQFSMFFDQFAIEISDKNIDEQKITIQLDITKKFEEAGYSNANPALGGAFNLFNILSREDIKDYSEKRGRAQSRFITGKFINHPNVVGAWDLKHLYKIYDCILAPELRVDEADKWIERNETIKTLSPEERVFVVNYFGDEDGKSANNKDLAGRIASLNADKKAYKAKREVRKSEVGVEGYGAGYNCFQADYCALLTMLLAFVDKPFFDLIAIEDLEKDANEQLKRAKEKKSDSMLERYCYYMFSTLFDIKKDIQGKYQVYLTPEIKASAYLKNKCHPALINVIEYLIQKCFKHVENFESIEETVIGDLKNFCDPLAAPINRRNSPVREITKAIATEREEISKNKMVFLNEELIWFIAELRSLADIYDFTFSHKGPKNDLVKTVFEMVHNVQMLGNKILVWDDLLKFINVVESIRYSGDYSLLGIFIQDPTLNPFCGTVMGKICNESDRNQQDAKKASSFFNILRFEMINALQGYEDNLDRGGFTEKIEDRLPEYIGFVGTRKNVAREEEKKILLLKDLFNSVWWDTNKNTISMADPDDNDADCFVIVDIYRKDWKIKKSGYERVFNSVVQEGVHYGVFQGSSYIRSVKFGSNVRGGVSLVNMFKDCENLVEVSFPGIDFTDGTVTSIMGLFEGCVSLTKIDNLDKWNTSNLTNMSRAFMKCTSLVISDRDSVLGHKQKIFDFFSKNDIFVTGGVRNHELPKVNPEQEKNYKEGFVFEGLPSSSDILSWFDLHGDYYTTSKTYRTGEDPHTTSTLWEFQNITWPLAYNEIVALYKQKGQKYTSEALKKVKFVTEANSKQEKKNILGKLSHSIGDTIEKIKFSHACKDIDVYPWDGTGAIPQFRQSTIVYYIGNAEVSLPNCAEKVSQEKPFFSVRSNDIYVKLPLRDIKTFTYEVFNNAKQQEFRNSFVQSKDRYSWDELNIMVDIDLKKLVGTDGLFRGPLIPDGIVVAQSVKNDFSDFMRWRSDKILRRQNAEMEEEKKFGQNEKFDLRNQEDWNWNSILSAYSDIKNNVNVNIENLYTTYYVRLAVLRDVLQEYYRSLNITCADKVYERIQFIREWRERHGVVGGNNYIYDSIFLTMPADGKLLGIEQWDVSKVVQADFMFYKCENLFGIDLSSWTFRQAVSFKFMFANCFNLYSCWMGKWEPGEGVGNDGVSCSYMFDHCGKLNQFGCLGGFIPCVSKSYNMFAGCVELKDFFVPGDMRNEYLGDNVRSVLGLWREENNYNQESGDALVEIKDVLNRKWLEVKKTNGGFYFAKGGAHIHNRIKVVAKVWTKDFTDEEFSKFNGPVYSNLKIDSAKYDETHDSYENTKTYTFYISDLKSVYNNQENPGPRDFVCGAFSNNGKLRSLDITLPNNGAYFVHNILANLDGLVSGCPVLNSVTITMEDSDQQVFNLFKATIPDRDKAVEGGNIKFTVRQIQPWAKILFKPQDLEQKVNYTYSYAADDDFEVVDGALPGKMVENGQAKWVVRKLPNVQEDLVWPYVLKPYEWTLLGIRTFDRDMNSVYDSTRGHRSAAFATCVPNRALVRSIDDNDHINNIAFPHELLVRRDGEYNALDAKRRILFECGALSPSTESRTYTLVDERLCY